MSDQLRVLIAEDDRFIRKAYEISLKAENLDVIVATDGIEAFEKAKAEHPNIILLDHLMPRQDGLSTLIDLKKDSETKDIPVIVFSNSEEKDICLKMLEAGALEVVVKSNISIEELLVKLRKYVKF